MDHGVQHAHGADANDRLATGVGFHLDHAKTFQTRGRGVDVTGGQQVRHEVP